MTQQHLAGGELLDALETGEVRVAERLDDGNWHVHTWVKEAILDVFRNSHIAMLGDPASQELGPFVDKDALPIRRFSTTQGVRLVPGGSSVRRGSHLAEGVVCMPPMYVNVGAFVGSGTMIDSHALVGSCAQIGARVHLSAAAQIGGVLEPIGARPVVLEDDVFVGGGSGIYEGTLVREGAVIAAGVVLTSGTPVYDLPNQRTLRSSSAAPLEIPARAVVVPGSRPVDNPWARDQGLQASCALIVKYRDERTDKATALEDALR